MKKILTIIALALIASLASAQTGVTFVIDENLSPVEDDAILNSKGTASRSDIPAVPSVEQILQRQGLSTLPIPTREVAKAKIGSRTVMLDIDRKAYNVMMKPSTILKTVPVTPKKRAD